MIEVVQAKNGSAVHVKNGKYLASSFDPQKEAETWWTHCQRLVKHSQTAFVLGLGSGYHVAILSRQISQQTVVVIECDQQLIDLNAKQFANTNVQVVHVADWRKLYQNEIVQKAVVQNYSVLLHSPSLNAEQEFFANAHKFLLARNVEGLFALLRSRPELLEEIDEIKLADLARSTEPVTIKTLTRLMKPGSYTNPNRRLWKVLEELVS